MYNIATYYRVSVDDDIGNDESFSITNQKLFLSEYLKNKEDIGNYNITEYRDDGYTGTNLQRPQFRKMLQDINVGLINCIIVKDFSRFARNYVDITDYLCNYFPLNNIRFISVNDYFDSKYNDPTELNISFKNLIYDFYKCVKHWITFNWLIFIRLLAWANPSIKYMCIFKCILASAYLRHSQYFLQ